MYRLRQGGEIPEHGSHYLACYNNAEDRAVPSGEVTTPCSQASLTDMKTDHWGLAFL